MVFDFGIVHLFCFQAFLYITKSIQYFEEVLPVDAGGRTEVDGFKQLEKKRRVLFVEA